jgi:hypothetical protein
VRFKRAGIERDMFPFWREPEFDFLVATSAFGPRFELIALGDQVRISAWKWHYFRSSGISLAGIAKPSALGLTPAGVLSQDSHGGSLGLAGE